MLNDERIQNIQALATGTRPPYLTNIERIARLEATLGDLLAEREEDKKYIHELEQQRTIYTTTTRNYGKI